MDRLSVCVCGGSDVSVFASCCNRATCACSLRLRSLALARARYSFRTQYCSPVRWPEGPRRGRHLALAPAAMHASCCRSVRRLLNFPEAAAKRARQSRCRNVRRLAGLT